MPIASAASSSTDTPTANHPPGPHGPKPGSLGAGLLQRVGDGVGLSLGDGPVVDQAVEGAVDPAVTILVVVLGRGAERADGEEAGTEHGGATGEESFRGLDGG